MRDRTHHAGGRAARKLRIGVESQNVPDLRKHVEPSGLDGEGIVLVHQKLVEVKQLAALALPAHPYSLAHVEHAVAMEEEKTAGVGRCIASVQFIDEMNGE